MIVRLAIACIALTPSAFAQMPPKAEAEPHGTTEPVGEPVRERLPDARGRRVDTLVYRLPDDLPPQRGMTIAQRRWMGARIAELPAGRRSVTIRCSVPPSGVVPVTAGCGAEGLASDGTATRIERLANLLRPALPALAAVEHSRSRAIRFRIRLDPADWLGAPPPGDGRRFDPAAAGPIMALLRRQLSDEYPDLALSMGLQAQVVARCLVEEDRSVTCRTESVEPEVARPYFAGPVDAIFPRGRLPERLTDGTPTPGLTFRVPVRFVIAG